MPEPPEGIGASVASWGEALVGAITLPKLLGSDEPVVKSSAALLKAFNAIDTEGSGRASVEALRLHARRVYGSQSVDSLVIEAILTAADTDNDGKLDFEQFQSCMAHLPDEKKKVLPLLPNELVLTAPSPRAWQPSPRELRNILDKQPLPSFSVGSRVPFPPDHLSGTARHDGSREQGDPTFSYETFYGLQLQDGVAKSASRSPTARKGTPRPPSIRRITPRVKATGRVASAPAASKRAIAPAAASPTSVMERADGSGSKERKGHRRVEIEAVRVDDMRPEASAEKKATSPKGGGGGSKVKARGVVAAAKHRKKAEQAALNASTRAAAGKMQREASGSGRAVQSARGASQSSHGTGSAVANEDVTSARVVAAPPTAAELRMEAEKQQRAAAFRLLRVGLRDFYALPDDERGTCACTDARDNRLSPPALPPHRPMSSPPCDASRTPSPPSEPSCRRASNSDILLLCVCACT